MNWGQFKEALRQIGVKDDMEIEYIDISDAILHHDELTVTVHEDGKSFSVGP